MSSDPLQTLSPSSLFTAHSPAATARSVSFGSIPGSQPGQLSYGFGLSSASNLNTAFAAGGAQPSASGWGSLPSWANKSPQRSAFGSASNIPVPSTSALPHSTAAFSQGNSPTPNRRRRRSVGSDDEADGPGRRVMCAVDTNAHSPQRPVRNVKKFRSTAQLNSDTTPSDPSSAPGSLAGAREGQDVGKALASLSREQLLALVSQLITAQPALRPAVAALLPAPTLASTLAAIAELERAVIGAIPSGAGARSEYIWGRVRGPVEEYITDARSFLSSFTAAINTPTSSAAVATGEDELSHPSTTFAFLYALTSSLRRLEVALPPAPARDAPGASSTASALSAHLLPLTINSWHVFLTRLSASVNQEGRILPASTVQTWFQRLEELSVPSPQIAGRLEGAARKACEGVRDRLRKEVGWLIGLREVGPVEMDEEEEL